MPATPSSSKLTPPNVSRVHARERLFRALDRARRRRLVWIEAAPGAGKTALVASWLASRRLRALWCTLDESDDVASFFDLLGRAAGKLGARGGMALPRFQPEHLATLGAYARQFLGALSSGKRAPEVVVLDDYHAVRQDSALHSALAAGIADVVGMSFVVASRGGPPRQLARLRATGEVADIPATSLALTRAEARAVARLRGRRAVPDYVLALANGWAAGVVLLAVAGPHEADAVARRSVFEYLAAEVFDQAEPVAREVLLRACLLPSVDGERAASLSGSSEAPAILDELARSGCFVDKVRSAPPTYRFHALFREFLAGRAREALGAGGFAALVRSTSALLLEGGDVEAAAALLAAEADWDELVRVLVERGAALAGAGRLESMRRWLDALPEAYAEAVPWVRFWRGASRVLSDPSAAIASVDAAFEAFLRAGDPLGTWRSWAAAIDMRVQALDDVAPLVRSLDMLPDLRARFPIPDPATEAAVVGSALSAYSNVRAADAAVRGWEDRALEIALAPGDARTRMDVGRQLAVRCAYWGTDLVRARLVLEALRPIATVPGADPMHALMWHFGESNYHTHVGDAAAALDAADRGLAIAARTGVHAFDSVLLAVRIYASLADEDFPSATRDLRAIAGVTAGGRLGACSYHYTAATVALRRGDLRDAVERSRAAARLGEEVGHPLALTAARVVWAAAASRGGGAGPTLEEAGALARDAGYDLALMGVLLLSAHAALERGAEQDADAGLRGAFDIARRTGALNSVYVTRAQLSELCAFALERSIEPELAGQIVRARRLAPGPRARRIAAWPWSVRVEALGGFALRCEGHEPPEGKAQRKPLELLRLLVANGERGATLDRLAEALWPDAEGDTAHHALETTMYRLRRLLGDPAAVVRSGGRALLDADRVFVDAWAVESLAARAEALRVRGDAAEAMRASAAAIDLYRGDLLPDDDDPALSAPRARLRERIARLSDLG